VFEKKKKGDFLMYPHCEFTLVQGEVFKVKKAEIYVS
jgi:hypothetical protein